MKNDLFKSRVFYGVLMAIGGGGLLFGSKILPLRIFGGGAAALATLVLANELFPSEETEEDVRTWCCPNCKGCPGFGVCEGSCDMCFEPYDDICHEDPWDSLEDLDDDIDDNDDEDEEGEGEEGPDDEDLDEGSDDDFDYSDYA